MSTLSFTNQFLIAMPSLADPNFQRTVTYVCEHNDRGAMGIVINRPLNLTLGEVFDTLHITQDMGLATSKEILEDIARGHGPAEIFVALGYAGWGAGDVFEDFLG